MLSCIALVVASATNGGQKVAQTPPMGWNSYDCFSYAVTEDEVIANATFMADRLRKLGWEYVVVDYVWSAPKLAANYAPDQDANFQPRFAMDSFGRLVPDPARFPSGAGGKSFRPLGERLHKMGLKFGIHLMRGIPRQAVADDCPVEGSKFTAKQAANKDSVCGWLNQMYGIATDNPAGQAYLDSIFRLYASWDVDSLRSTT